VEYLETFNCKNFKEKKMAVVIRLARYGRKKLPYYRMVVADKQMPRDGRYLERVGSVDPLAKPAKIEINQERIKYWISVGACASDRVARIINAEIPGFLEEQEKSRDAKIVSKRAKRKAKNKGKKSEKSASKQRKLARATREKKVPVKKATPVEAPATETTETSAE
jgi:small subunit ribosomal protein S16